MGWRGSLIFRPMLDTGFSQFSPTKRSFGRCISASMVRLHGRRTSNCALTRLTRISLANRPRHPMPEVSRFYGIIIRFYYRDHPPTHFHAIYGEYEAQIEIESGAIHRGRLPKTAYDLVNTWRLIHLQEL